MQKYFAKNFNIFSKMTNIGNNIKKLRKVRGLSQQSFADLFNLSRGNISSYEELRAEPKIETVMTIANYFSIPLQSLIQENLSVNQILNFSDYFEPATVANSTKKLANIPLLTREVMMNNNDLLKQIAGAPQLQLPIQSKNKFLAIEFSELIAAPLELEVKEQSILIFEGIEIESLHLLHNNLGLFLSEEEVFVGKYEQNAEQIALILNSWKSSLFSLPDIKYYWKLYGKFEKV